MRASFINNEQLATKLNLVEEQLRVAKQANKGLKNVPAVMSTQET